MREVINDSEEAITLKLKNSYGKTIAAYKIESQESISLPLFSEDERLMNDNKQVFIYAGSGELNISECYTKYNFSDIDVKDLDYYLQHQKAPLKAKAKEQLQAFIELMESNLNLGYDKIKPPLYEKLERDLLFYRNEDLDFRFVF